MALEVPIAPLPTKRPKRQCTQHGEREMLKIIAEAFARRDEEESCTLLHLRDVWTPENPILQDVKHKGSVASGIFCSLNGHVTTNIEAISMLKKAYSEQSMDNYSLLLRLKMEKSGAKYHNIFIPMALGRDVLKGAMDNAHQYVLNNMLEDEVTHAIFCPIHLDSRIALVCCHLTDESLYLFSTGKEKAADHIFSAFQQFITGLSVKVVKMNGDAIQSAIFTRQPINADIDLSKFAAVHSGPLVCVLMDILSNKTVEFDSIAEYVHNKDMRIVRAWIFTFMHGFNFHF
jgi:hypothetical protein